MQIRQGGGFGPTPSGTTEPIDRNGPSTPESAPSPHEDASRAATRQVANGLARLGSVVRTEAWQARGRTGLTPTQAQILSLLRSAEPEALSLRALAEGIGVTSATASESLDTLVGKGMAVRARSARDARALAVRLTDDGRREADAAGDAGDALLTATRELVEFEQAAFLRGLTRMVRRLHEEGRVPAPRMCANCRYFRPRVHAGDDAPHHCAWTDAPFGDRQLRIDCADFAPAEPDIAARNWELFSD